MKQIVTSRMSMSFLEGEYIGLDVGDSRIGVARINTIAKMSEPLHPIATASQEPFKAILAVITQQGAVGVVLGLPRGLAGQETEQTQKIYKFVAKLRKKTEIPLFLIDEAGTSKEAEKRISKHNSSLDSNAACIILEDFIDFNDKELLRVK